jgi:peptidoglycan-associated lipoprotein
MIRIAISVLSSAFALSVVACTRDSVAPPATAASTPLTRSVPVTRTFSSIFPVKASTGVNVSDELRRSCEIGLGSVERAPKFDFDKSDLRGDERAVLEEIASCVTTGPLEGRSLRLVGRADPRGSAEYNLALGHARAANVSSYLESRGVDGSKISTTSRGSFEAAGYDEATWRLDRRVDVGLD